MDLTTNQRLLSLDAYRGFIMLLMASSGLGVAQMADDHPGTIWEMIRPHFEHKAWQGCSLWDLIQPSFMFMVGVAVPWSCAKRREHGQSFLEMAVHALTRSVLLVALGVMLATKAADKQTVFLFTNVLAQIGLGYFFLFIISRLGWEYMAAGIIAILAGYTWFFIQQPPPSAEELAAIAGMKGTEGALFQGFAAHWNIHTNAAAHFDRWFLNELPRAAPFTYANGGYQTLNFIPSLATMLGGAITGDFLMRSQKTEKRKCATLIIAGVVLLLIGTILDITVLPAVKRIWTPTWAILSGGWVLVMLSIFYLLVEIIGMRRLVFPLVVVGMNSIAIYMLHSLCGGWIREQLQKHLPEGVFADHWPNSVQECLNYMSTGMHLPPELIPPPPEYWTPVVERVGVVFVLWLVCFWLYRQKAFLKL